MALRILTLATGIAIVFATAAFASQTPSTDEVTVTAEKPSEKIVCHYVAHNGTVLPKPFCGTQKAWDEAMRRQQQDVAEIQRRNLDFTTRH